MFIHTYTEKIDWRYPEVSDWQVAAFQTPRQNRSEITSWCYKTFGPPGLDHLTHQIRWKDSIQWGEVYFSNREDLMMFVMRWT